MIGFEIQFLFIIVLPFWLVYRVINCVLKTRGEKRFHLKRELFVNVFFLYCLTVVGITFFPLFIGNDGLPGQFININYVPVINTLNELKGIHNSNIPIFMLKFWFRNIVGNLVLLLPLGIFLPILWNWFRSLKAVVITGFLISFFIEILQLLSVLIGNRGRAFDVDDLILNTIGVAIGYWIFFLFHNTINKSRRYDHG